MLVEEKSPLVTNQFTVVCSVTWPLDDSEAGGDLVLIQIALHFLCVNQVVLMLTSWHLIKLHRQHLRPSRRKTYSKTSDHIII